MNKFCNFDATFCALYSGLVNAIINPLLLLLTGIAGVVFLWGVVEFLWNQQAGDNKKAGEGKLHLLYGLIGLFIIVGAFGIFSIIGSTIQGLSGQKGDIQNK